MPKPLILTFLGGGSRRILGLLRGALGRGLLQDGGIRLFDPREERAAAVAAVLRRTPEFAASPCRVSTHGRSQEALEGADLVYAVFPCGSRLRLHQSMLACRLRGHIGSDQLSPSGAIMALKGGPIILDYARQMERCCPGAWMVVFANPVAVYSAIVNHATRITGLGVCGGGGFSNHLWDLSRLQGRDAPRTDISVDAAGVNHCAFILRGTVGKRDLWETLAPVVLDDGWREPEPAFGKTSWPTISLGLRKHIELYRRFGVMPYSTEFDGLAHLFPDDVGAWMRGNPQERSAADWQAETARWRAREEEESLRFAALARDDLPAGFWSTEDRRHGPLARADHNNTAAILDARAGRGPRKICVSSVSRGAVPGFPDRAVLEFSQWISREGLRPAGNLFVPEPLHGLTASLAMHQTLLADAVVSGDPRTLYHALHAYPVRQNCRETRALFRELLRINEEEIPRVFQQTCGFLD